MTQLLCLFHCLVPVDRQQLVGTPRSLSPFFVTWHVGLLLFALSMHTCAPGLRIWVFSGDVDGIVPVLGSRRWIEGLELPLVTPWRPWRSATGQARRGAARRGAVHWDVSRSILKDLPQQHQHQQQKAAVAAAAVARMIPHCPGCLVRVVNAGRRLASGLSQPHVCHRPQRW